MLAVEEDDRGHFETRVKADRLDELSRIASGESQVAPVEANVACGPEVGDRVGLESVLQARSIAGPSNEAHLLSREAEEQVLWPRGGRGPRRVVGEDRGD